MSRNTPDESGKADVEAVLENLAYHSGRQARVYQLIKKKLEQEEGGAVEDEMDDADLDRVAGGLHIPAEEKGFLNNPK